MNLTNVFLSELIPESAIRRICSETSVGLELIQFSISDNLDHYDRTMQTVREMLSRIGCPAITIHGPFLDLNPMSFDSLVRQAALVRFGQAYEAARELGARKIIYHSGMIPTVYFTEGWADRMVDFWSEFLQDRKGITVCMENVLDREIGPILEVAQRVQHPDFGLCLDIGHAHCYSGQDVREWTETLGSYVKHLHLHDNDGTRDAHLAIGAGTIPWREVLEILDAANTCEPLTYTIECSSEKAVRDSIRLLQDII